LIHSEFLDEKNVIVLYRYFGERIKPVAHCEIKLKQNTKTA